MFDFHHFQSTTHEVLRLRASGAISRRHSFAVLGVELLFAELVGEAGDLGHVGPERDGDLELGEVSVGLSVGHDAGCSPVARKDCCGPGVRSGP
jgi:hypothetical protein